MSASMLYRLNLKKELVLIGMRLKNLVPRIQRQIVQHIKSQQEKNKEEARKEQAM